MLSFCMMRSRRQTGCRLSWLDTRALPQVTRWPLASRRQQQEIDRQREQARFVFVAPRVDLQARQPPPRAELSDLDRKARTTERAEKPTSNRPKNFAEDWDARGTARPPTTIANPATDIQPPPPVVAPRSIGDRYRRLSVEELAGVPYVDYIWGRIDISPDGSEVAFSWNRSGTFEIFSAPLDGERIFQLTGASERSVWLDG